MKRNLDQTVKGPDGNEFPDAATLKALLFQAATTPLEGDNTLPADQKLKLYSLAQRIHAGGVVDFVVEDIALLKDRMRRGPFSIWAFGQVCGMLDSDYQEPDK